MIRIKENANAVTYKQHLGRHDCITLRITLETSVASKQLIDIEVYRPSLDRNKLTFIYTNEHNIVNK